VSNQYRDTFAEHGLAEWSQSERLLTEIVELGDHPWFIAASSTRSCNHGPRACTCCWFIAAATGQKRRTEGAKADRKPAEAAD
jgi:CTP synthase (UTP-ammonia lyase)